MEYRYETSGTCSRVITFNLDNDIVTNVKFVGGCHGNLQALSKLVDGMSVKEIESKLKGINCNGRGTSCADQLYRAVKEAYEKNKG